MESRTGQGMKMSSGVVLTSVRLWGRCTHRNLHHASTPAFSSPQKSSGHRSRCVGETLQCLTTSNPFFKTERKFKIRFPVAVTFSAQCCLEARRIQVEMGGGGGGGGGRWRWRASCHEDKWIRSRAWNVDRLVFWYSDNNRQPDKTSNS